MVNISVISAALSFLAALFAYLGWVRMTTRSRTDIQDELDQQYGSGEVTYGEYEGSRVIRLVVTRQEGIMGKLRTHFLPFSADAGNTKVYVSYDVAKSYIIVERPYPEYGIKNVTGEGTGVLSIEFATTNPNELEAYLQNLPDILSDVIDTFGIPEEEQEESPNA